MSYERTTIILTNGLYVDVNFNNNYTDIHNYNVKLHFYSLYNNGYNCNNLIIYDNYKFSGDISLSRTKKDYMYAHLGLLYVMKTAVKLFNDFICYPKNINHYSNYNNVYIDYINSLPKVIKNKRIFKEFIEILDNIEKGLK